MYLTFGLRAKSAAAARVLGNADGGGDRARTDDLLLAKQALSRLSYTPVQKTDARSQKRGISAVLISAFCHLNGGPGRI